MFLLNFFVGDPTIQGEREREVEIELHVSCERVIAFVVVIVDSLFSNLTIEKC